MKHIPSGWWWLSFADPSQPRGQQFLGGAIICAHDLITAIDIARRQGINPGGEVVGLSIEIGRVPPERWLGRLLTRGEALEIKAWGDARWPEDQS